MAGNNPISFWLCLILVLFGIVNAMVLTPRRDERIAAENLAAITASLNAAVAESNKANAEALLEMKQEVSKNAMNIEILFEKTDPNRK